MEYGSAALLWILPSLRKDSSSRSSETSTHQSITVQNESQGACTFRAPHSAVNIPCQCKATCPPFPDITQMKGGLAVVTIHRLLGSPPIPTQA